MIWQLLRTEEWLDSKISYYLFAMLLLLYEDGLRFEHFVFVQLCLLFFVCYIAASYLVNDISDIKTDIKSGKKKRIVTLPRAYAFGLLAAVCAVGILPLLCYERSVQSAVLTAVIYFCGFSYSLKPLRLKERGIFGTIWCSAAQKCVPILLVLLRCPFSWRMVPVLLLSFFIGMRYILIHQLSDIQNDKKANVSTFSLHHPSAARTLLYCNVAAELCMLGLIAAGFMLTEGFAAGLSLLILLPVCVLLMLFNVRAVRYMLGEHAFETFSFVPLEECYSLLLPLWCCCLGAFHHPVWLLDAAFVLLIQFRITGIRVQFYAQYIRALARQRKEHRT